jgi:putative hydrolase of the HAD superfamily
VSRALIFDVDGVLIHGMHANPVHVRRWDANLQADLGVDPARFVSEFIYDIFVKRVVIGQISVIEALERRLPGLGYHGSPMAFLQYWLEHDSTLNLPLLEIIGQLKANVNIRLYMATNQEHMRAHWLWSHLRLSDLFDDIFYSARIGVRKPDPRFFNYINSKIGPQEQAPLFFDDTPAVVAGALGAGWEAVLFNTVEDCTSHKWISEHVASS